MAVQLLMHLGRGDLLDDFEGVAVHLNVELKFKFEAALVLAIDRDRSLILPFIRLGLVVVDHSVGYQEVLRIVGVSCCVRVEKQPVIAEEELADVFGFLHLAHFESIQRLLFGFVVETGQTERLSVPILDIGSDLGWITLLQGPIARAGLVHHARDE